jgi:hypothetical protein
MICAAGVCFNTDTSVDDRQDYAHDIAVMTRMFATLEHGGTI